MKCLLLMMTAVFAAFAQDQALAPASEFDLHAGLKLPRHARLRSWLAATPAGLTLVTVGENLATLTAADPAGRILHTRSDLASVHAQIYAALPRPDGSVWLVSSGPTQAFGAFAELGSALPAPPSTGRSNSGPANFSDLDLYNPAGEHLRHLRLLAFVTGSGTPIAAGDDELVLRGNGTPGSPQVLQFGSVADAGFQERTHVRLDPPIRFAFAELLPGGELALIDRKSGDTLLVDPRTHGGSVAHLPQPRPVQAVASDGDSLYLLTGPIVLKTDLNGHILASYRLQLRRSFQAAAIAVTGPNLYVVDPAGMTARFELP